MKPNKYFYESTEALRLTIEGKENLPAWRDKCYLIEKKPTQKLRKFAGVRSTSEALNLLKCGDVENAKKIRSALEKIESQQNDVRRVFERSVVGCIPNVPAYLLGLPKQMYNVKVQYTETPTLNLYVNTSCYCGITTEQMSEAGAKIANCIKAIEEEKDIRVNLYAVSAIDRIEGTDYSEIISVCIKKAENPLNLINMAFCFVNPAFFRVVCLMHLQKFCPKSDPFYGCPMRYNDIKKEFTDGCFLSTLDIIENKKNSKDIAEEINKYLNKQ